MKGGMGEDVDHERHEKHEIGEDVGQKMKKNEEYGMGVEFCPEKYETEETILFREECYAIQGAIFEVYRVMGCGFLEAVYQECLEKEFSMQNIPFSAQRELELDYKGKMLKQRYKPDFICFNKIIVEIKAVKEIAPVDSAP